MGGIGTQEFEFLGVFVFKIQCDVRLVEQIVNVAKRGSLPNLLTT